MSSSRLGEKLPAPLALRRPTCAWNVAGKSRLSISTVVFVEGIRTPKCRVMLGLLKRSGTQRDQRRTGDDPVGDAAQALDLADNLVAHGQPRKAGGVARPELGQAAVTAGARAQHVARGHFGPAGRVGDDLADRPVGVGPLVAAILATVDRDDHLEVVAVLTPPGLDLVLGHEPRTESGRRVFARGGAGPHFHLVAPHA